MMTVGKIRYRAAQFFHALYATISAEDWALVDAIFDGNAAARALFDRMTRADRHHAIAVARALQQRGHTDSHLLQAALLHDVGKSLGQPIVHRVLVVIFSKCCPALLKKLAAAPLDCAGWRRPFVVSERHPQIGAQWAREAGCAPQVVRLIAHHQRRPAAHPISPEQQLHAALYAADNEN